MIRFLLPLALLASPALADRLTATATCEPAGMTARCTIALADGETPLDGAAFTVTPSMPSMPMAHSMTPADASATPVTGRYTVDLHLEMGGDWLLTLDVSQPRRDRLVVGPVTVVEE